MYRGVLCSSSEPVEVLGSSRGRGRFRGFLGARLLEHLLGVVDALREVLEGVATRGVEVVFGPDGHHAGLVHEPDGVALIVPDAFAHADRPVPVHADHDFLGLAAGGEHGFDADGQKLPGVEVNEPGEELGVDGLLDTVGHGDTGEQNMRELVIDEHGLPAERTVYRFAEFDGLLDGLDVVQAGVAGLPLEPHFATGVAEGFHPVVVHHVHGLGLLHGRVVGISHPTAGPGRPPDADARAEAFGRQIHGTLDGFLVQIRRHDAVILVQGNHAAAFGAREPELGGGHGRPTRESAAADTGLEFLVPDGAGRVEFPVARETGPDLEQGVPRAAERFVALQPQLDAELDDGLQPVLDLVDARQDDAAAELGVARPRAQCPCRNRMNPFRILAHAVFPFFPDLPACYDASMRQPTSRET